MLQKVGYLAQIKYGRRTGTPYIRFKMERKLILVRFYACKRHNVMRCLGLAFTTGYKLNKAFPLKRLNRWHAKRRYTYAYRGLRQPNVIWLSMDLTFSAGMTPAIFAKYLGYFRIREGWFRKHIGFSM